MNSLMKRSEARYIARSLSRQTGIKHIAVKGSYVPVDAFLSDDDFGESKRVFGYSIQMKGKA